MEERRKPGKGTNSTLKIHVIPIAISTKSGNHEKPTDHMHLLVSQ